MGGLRGLFIVIFGVIFYFLLIVIWLVVIFQFLTKLLTGSLNQQLMRFGASLTEYVQQVLSYVTFQSDLRPFPFSPYPGTEIQGSTAGSGAKEEESRTLDVSAEAKEDKPEDAGPPEDQGQDNDSTEADSEASEKPK